MNAMRKLKLVVTVALAALALGGVILFLGMVTTVSADLSVITVQVVPDTLIANSGQTAAVTATVSGTTVSGVVVTISLSAGSLGTVTPFTGTTDATGQVTYTWTAGTVIGSGTLYITDDVVTGEVPVTLTAGTPTTITLQVDPATLTANSGQTSPITATVVDVYNNHVAGVTLSGNTTPATLGGIAMPGTTNANGQAFGTWTAGSSIGAGSMNVGNGSVTGTASITLTAGTPTTIILQVNPTTLIANSSQSSPITATVVDTYNNRVSGVTLSGNTTPATLGGVAMPAATNANGQAFGTWTAGSSPGAGSIKIGNGSVTGTAFITLTVGLPYTVTLQPDVASTVVTTTYIGLTAIVVDHFENPVANGTTVTFATSLGDILFSQRTTTFGVAVSGIRSTQAGTAQITATSGSVSGTAIVAFTPDVPYSITLQAIPVTQTVGNNSVLTATVYDQFHNTVTNTVTITFSRNLGNLAPTVVTTTNGVATSRISDTVSGPRFITATSQPPALAGTTTVTFTPDVPFTVTLTAQPITQTVGNNSVLTATVTDRYGNWVTNGTPVTFTVSHGYVVSRTTTTGGAATSLMSDTLAGPQGSLRIITATSGTKLDTATVTFMPGAPFSMTLLANPSSVTITVPSLLDATVYDQYGNFVLNGTPVTFDKDLGSVLSPVTTTNGLARSSISYPFVATAHITATSGTVTRTTTVTFTPDVPASVLLQVSPTPQTVGNNSVLTATVRDWIGNLVANGTPVTFTVNHGYVVSRTTTSSGIATSLISDTLVGTRIITATSKPAPPVTTTIVFNPDVPYSMTLVAVPTLLVVGNNSVLTATVFDRYHNTVMNSTPVTFTASRGNVVSPVTTTSGIARSLISDTLAGTRLITATSGLAQITTTVVFTPDVPYTITVLVNPITMVANSGATAVITATILDVYNNLLAGQTLTGTFPITTMGTVSGLGVTNVAGQAFGAWQAGSALGHAPLRVSNGSITGTKEVSLVGSAPTTVTVQVSPSTLVANSRMTGTITATVVDVYGNPLPDVGPTGSTIPSTLGTVGDLDFTDSNGRAFSIWTASEGSQVGKGLLRVSVSDSVSGTAAITLTYSTPTTATLQINPTILVARSGVTAAITATVNDLYYNRVPSVTLGIGITPTTVGNVNWQSSTNTNGQAFGTWTAGTVPGSGQFQGGSLSTTGTTTVTLDLIRTYLPVALKNFPPIPTSPSVRINNGAESTYQTTVTLELTATVEGDTIAWVRLSNDNIHWSNWLTYTPTMTWVLDSSNGLKTVYAQLMGHWGGISAVTSDSILLFNNGNFAQNLARWTVTDPVGLGVTTSFDPVSPTNPAGRLGNPGFGCDNVPIGSASLSQSFIMPNIPTGKQLLLRFSYHIYSFDRNDFLDPSYDRFVVLLNNRQVLSDMVKGLGPQCSTANEVGPKNASINVTGILPGSPVNVGFILYNKPDKQYNTYVYLDDVRLELQ